MRSLALHNFFFNIFVSPSNNFTKLIHNCVGWEMNVPRVFC